MHILSIIIPQLMAEQDFMGFSHNVHQHIMGKQNFSGLMFLIGNYRLDLVTRDREVVTDTYNLSIIEKLLESNANII